MQNGVQVRCVSKRRLGILGGIGLLLSLAFPALASPGPHVGVDREPSTAICGATIRDLHSANPGKADRAYLRLYSAGKLCIPDLLNLATDKSLYAGAATQDPESCEVVMAGTLTVDRVALYLVEGILMGSPTPHFALRLTAGDSEGQDQRFEQAFATYQDWWDSHTEMTLAELRATPHPLHGTHLSWLGDTTARTPQRVSSNLTAIAPWIEVPGSGTPATNPAVCVAQQNPYSWILKPGGPGNTTPYNCFAWGLNCQNDRWIEPNPDVPGNGWKDILRDNGYDPDKAADCAKPACPDGGKALKMVFEVCPGNEDPTDDNWVHAMKQEADGDWTSKNGQGPLYTDIKDCMKFINKFYPPAPGKSNKVLCFCPTTVVVN